MAQTLLVKMPGGTIKKVRIIRSFGDIGGKQVYYHTDGRYAWKDGSPLKSASDLDIVPQGIHHDHAMSWWTSAGEEEARRFYASKAAAAAAAVGDFREDVPDSSTLDAVLYTRRGTDKKNSALSAPRSWPEWFAKRPDWWGQAEKISFPDYTYETAKNAGKKKNHAPDANDSLNAPDPVFDIPAPDADKE